MQPSVGIVLGSGLGAFAQRLREPTCIPYAEIEGMVSASVPGHTGQLVLGRYGALPLAVLQGRIHLYEGHAPEQVVLGTRLLVRLGASVVILTNAAGGIHPDLDPGALMLVEDHLNLTGQNALVGAHDEELGPRFPSMSEVYDPGLRALTRAAAADAEVDLSAGVYAGLLGPSYETPAEIRMLRTLGADAVGMSTVLEAMAVRHMGARCLAISCITNRAAGLHGSVLDHDEVQRIAQASSERFALLLDAVLSRLERETRA
jgi:purine-nucleoside phosphorylase